jgi:hypothetical protein
VKIESANLFQTGAVNQAQQAYDCIMIGFDGMVVGCRDWVIQKQKDETTFNHLLLIC